MSSVMTGASTIEDIEWLAGKLLVVSAKLRKDRMGSGDAHEMRHLLAALDAGNSDSCGPIGEHCVLDAAPERPDIDVKRLALAIVVWALQDATYSRPWVKRIKRHALADAHKIAAAYAAQLAP